MNIGDVLSQAWKTIWKHKVLWIFGIFAGCSSASYSTGNGGVSYQVDAPLDVQKWIDTIDPALAAIYVGLLILVALVIIILVIFFGTIGRIGIIRGTSQSQSGAERLTFGQVFSSSTPYFWRVFGLNLLIAVVAFIAAVGLVIFGVLGTVFTLGLALLCFIPLLCLLVPAVWLLSIWVEQSIIAIVVEDKSIMDGLGRGWQVFKENFGDMLALGLIFLILGVLVTLLLILPLAAVAIPLVTGFISGTPEAISAGLVVAIVSILCYMPIFLVLNGILRAYIGSAWTLNFLRYSPAATAPEETEQLPSPI